VYAASHFAGTVEARYRLVAFVQHSSARVDRYTAHRVVDAGADSDGMEAGILYWTRHVRPTEVVILLGRLEFVVAFNGLCQVVAIYFKRLGEFLRRFAAARKRRQSALVGCPQGRSWDFTSPEICCNPTLAFVLLC
jgi:hypothetical protein